MQSLDIVRKFFPKVASVKDATRQVSVEVTARDIRSAKVKSHKGCAMAVACKRKFRADGVIVSRAVTYVVRGTQATRYMVSGPLEREIIAFDRGGSFEPGEFPLLKPHAAVHINRQRKAPTGRKTGTKPRSTPHHITANIRTSLVGAV